MARDEIEMIKKAEKDALEQISNAEKEAKNIVKKAKAQGEAGKKKELEKFREEMAERRKQSEKKALEEATMIKGEGGKEAEDIKTKALSRVDSASSHIVKRVIES